MKTIKWMLSFFTCLLLAVYPVSAQVNSPDDEVYSEVDEMPEFKGGQEALMQFVMEKIVYPEKAKKEGIQGKVFVSFIVDEKGEVAQANIERSANSDLDNEALRVINLMPAWNPGKLNGKAVKVKLTLPVMFALGSDNGKG